MRVVKSEWVIISSIHKGWAGEPQRSGGESGAAAQSQRNAAAKVRRKLNATAFHLVRPRRARAESKRSARWSWMLKPKNFCFLGDDFA